MSEVKAPTAHHRPLAGARSSKSFDLAGSLKDVLLGITGKDFTIIAASKAAMRGATVLKASDDKTRPLSKHILMALTGEAGDTIQFAEYVQANVQLYGMRNDIELNPSATASFIRTELAKALRSRRPYTVNLLLGGYDTINDKPTLHWIDYLASSAPVPYAAHGYAQYYCLSTLDKHHHPDISFEQGMKILRMCTDELKRRLPIDFKGMTVKVVTKDGIREEEYKDDEPVACPAMAIDIAPTSDSIVPRVVTIVDDHDLILRVTQHTRTQKAAEDGRDKTKAVVDFQVTRQYLVDNSESDFLKRLLTTRHFAEAGKRIIDLDEQNPLAIEVILCTIYRKDEGWRSSALGQEVTARTLKLHWEYLWDVVASTRYFMIEFFNLDTWFGLWYEKNHTADNSKLLYPCYQFNHAVGFLSITKNLVYNHAHIEEYKNENHPDLHVPPRIIGALNGARGHLRVVLARWLWAPLQNMMTASCACKGDTVYLYLQALAKTGGYPVDQQGRKSVNDICHQLGLFKEHFHLPQSSKGCAKCARDWTGIVARAVHNIQEYFDGICLDCMDHTQPKFLDEHDDYWNHLSLTMKWDLKCRVSHGQASWYSSFMGRPDTRETLLKRVKKRFNN
ncbi:N-terminal nucleophile aminohydrolase, partial [Aureobasidium melanogenum]